MGEGEGCAAMSGGVHFTLSTSPRSGRPPRVGVIRMEEDRPFNPGKFGFQMGSTPAPTRQPLGAPLHPFHALQQGARRARTVPVGNYQELGSDEEKARLIEDRHRQGIDLPSSLTLCAAVALWVIIVCVVFIMYWQFSSGIASASEAMKPYFESAVNHTMSILLHVDQSTIGAHEMVEGAQSVTDRAVPAMQLALNQTAAMLARLEKLAANPVMQISLTGATTAAGGTVGGGVAG
mgnify:FL=1